MKQKLKIGLEIHTYLNTKEKLFCTCKAEHGIKNTKPNSNICPICTGQPGAKPMLQNSEALRKTLQAALMLNCKINLSLPWKRKHYSWPDLPKGYQNTLSGPHAFSVGVSGKFQNIKITEVHLEEDPAAWDPESGEIDYNRSGFPLMEIVTEPEFNIPEQVTDWLKQLLLALSYIKSIDKNLGIKCDVNISTTGERVEIKNMNSLANIKQAILYEIKRQEKEPVKEQETRMFDVAKGITKVMRTKEQAADYRFISDPDLPAIILSKNYIKKIKSSLPETPEKKLKKLIKTHKIDKESALVLTQNIDIVEFFENILKQIPVKLALPWTTVELLRVLNYNKKTLDEVNINPEHFIELLKLIQSNQITELKAKQILNEFFPKSFSPKERLKGSEKISGSNEIETFAKQAMKNNPQAVTDFQSGKEAALNFLIGDVMKLSNRRADYRTAKAVLEKLLK